MEDLRTDWLKRRVGKFLTPDGHLGLDILGLLSHPDSRAELKSRMHAGLEDLPVEPDTYVGIGFVGVQLAQLLAEGRDHINEQKIPSKRYAVMIKTGRQESLLGETYRISFDGPDGFERGLQIQNDKYGNVVVVDTEIDSGINTINAIDVLQNMKSNVIAARFAIERVGNNGISRVQHINVPARAALRFFPAELDIDRYPDLIEKGPAIPIEIDRRGVHHHHKNFGDQHFLAPFRPRRGHKAGAVIDPRSYI